MNWLRLWHFSSFSLSLTATLLALAACDRHAEQREAVTALMGREITMPEGLQARILDTPIGFEPGADFTVVCYIDSAGCTPCRMKLPVWNEVINSFKAIPGRDVSFVMILQSPDTTETGYTLRRDSFMHPVAMDRAGSFAAVNSLPADEATHTLLLDADGRVAAIGNPALNPKIRDLYRRIISGSDEAPPKTDKPLCQNPVAAVGAVGAGDTVTKRFALYNPETSPLTLQELVGSCDCTVATASSDTIPAGGSAMITVSIAADTLLGPFLHWVDIYYNERDCPERLTLHGLLYK